MGIPRKKSKKIRVNFLDYLYLIKEVTVPNHPDQKRNRITIQENSKAPGRVMQFHLPWGFPFTRRMAKNAILIGLDAGWKPQERGPAFQLNL